MTFYEWAMTRKVRNTPRGDFLTDMQADGEAPTIPNTRQAWVAHLEAARACDGAMKAFKSAWREYQRTQP
jgi:hypothetical protein